MTRRVRSRVVTLCGTACALVCVLLAACGERGGAGPGASGAVYDARGAWLGSTPAPRPAHGRNLVLVVIDTLRADAVAHMPFLLELGARGVRFEQASAPAPWTPPSMATLLTGLMPFEHGCNELDRPWLSDALPTYAEVLSRSFGYQCVAFVDGPWFGEQAALLQGFEVGGLNLGLTQIRRGLDRWLQRRDPGRPFFLLIHTFDAHDPYGPLPPASEPPPAPLPETLSDAQITRWFMMDARRRGQLLARLGPELALRVMRYTYQGYRDAADPELAADLRRAYYEGVAWVDGLLRETVAHLEAQGLLDDTWLVVTSDHGEAFGEHRLLGHGRDLHDEMLRVPLVALGAPPYQGGQVSTASVGLVDVLATFLESEGLPPLPGAHGRSLAAALAKGGEGGWPVWAQERIDSRTAPVEQPILLSSVRMAARKWILRHGGPPVEAQAQPPASELQYDLLADPGEKQPRPPGDGVADGTFLARVEQARAAQERLWGELQRAGGQR